MGKDIRGRECTLEGYNGGIMCAEDDDVELLNCDTGSVCSGKSKLVVFKGIASMI